MPRKRRTPKHVDDQGAKPYHPETAQDGFRAKYDEVLHIVSEELKRHFDQAYLQTMATMEKLLLDFDSANGCAQS